MRKIITILITIISLTSYSQDSASYNFEVEIVNLRNSEGKVLIQIFDKEKNVIKTLISNIENNICLFEISNLPKGEYAIRYFHDENNDGKLDMRWGIIPNEGFGYTNNAKGMFGEPDFKDWLFLLDENKSLHLKCSYLF